MNVTIPNLSRLRPLYTDFSLHCNGHALPAHRLILGLHSPDVFGKSFSGWSCDTQTSSLEIHNAQPDAVKARLDFFYTGTYDVPEGMPSPLGFHLEVYQLADRYQCQALLEESLERFEGACRSDGWDTSTFVKVARDLESSELAHKKTLRIVVLETMRAKLETLLLSQEFADLLSDCQSLNLALLRSLAREGASVVSSKGQKRRQQGLKRGNDSSAQKNRWRSPGVGVSRR